MRVNTVFNTPRMERRPFQKGIGAVGAGSQIASLQSIIHWHRGQTTAESDRRQRLSRIFEVQLREILKQAQRRAVGEAGLCAEPTLAASLATRLQVGMRSERHFPIRSQSLPARFLAISI